MNRNRSIVWPLVAALVVLFLIVGLYVFVTFKNPGGLSFPLELLIGLPILFGVSVLLILLFIMAAGFRALHLNDPRQALGLPEGSIRALIALLLIVVWIILSVFLLDILNVVGRQTPANPNNDSIIKLAQQLLTTMGTLVVAVSAFYFGTSSIATARSVTPPLSPPVIRKIDPINGKQGEGELPLTILGKNFRSPKTVRLVQGPEEMVATDILSNDAEIHCKINIKTDQKLVFLLMKMGPGFPLFDHIKWTQVVSC